MLNRSHTLFYIYYINQYLYSIRLCLACLCYNVSRININIFIKSLFIDISNHVRSMGMCDIRGGIYIVGQIFIINKKILGNCKSY